MFWDSSALVPLLLPEQRSSGLASLLGSDASLTIWWASPVECQSAIYRRHRITALPQAVLLQAMARLQMIVEDADVVAATEAVRSRASRLLAVHPLHAADALQLAAALVWSEERPFQAKFVCLDQRLSTAAVREGFSVIPVEE